ncbi:MAG: EAL domain-containing protein [Tepidamorphaceae bacterium]
MAWIGIGLFLLMIVIQLFVTRGTDSTGLVSRLDDIGGASGKLAREIESLNLRIADLEVALAHRLEDSLQERITPVLGELGRIEERLGEIARNGLPQSVTQTASGDADEDEAVAAAGANGKAAPADKTAPRRSEAFVGIDDDTMKQLVRDAVEAGRVEIHLQPIVSLPQRKVRYYEALARLRTDAGDLMQPDDFLPFARMQDLMPAIDFTVLVRAVQVVRRLTSKNREVGVFLNVSLSTLQDERFANRYVEFAEHNKALASSIIFEFSQREYVTVGPLEQVGFDQLAELGFRFSVDAVERLTLDGKAMSEKRVRFVKVDAELLLQANGGISSDIHPADLSDLLARFGIDLIAMRIERESEVVDLIDYDVRFAQGNLFSPPRPVKADILQDASATLEAAQ